MDERWKLTEKLWKSNENRRKLAENRRMASEESASLELELTESVESKDGERDCKEEQISIRRQKEKQQASFNFVKKLNRFSRVWGWIA